MTDKYDYSDKTLFEEAWRADTLNLDGLTCYYGTEKTIDSYPLRKLMKDYPIPDPPPRKIKSDKYIPCDSTMYEK